MRTTLTLEPDVAAKLKELAHRRRISFKEAVDSVLRRGLSAQESGHASGKAFRTATFRSAFCAGVDPARLNQLVDEIEAGRFANK